MPWLEKDNPREKASQNLLFVHVPRCGGTSLMKSHNVPAKVIENSNFFHKLGMKLFFRRYKLLESANFPIWTKGNAVCTVMVVLNCYLRFVVLAKDGLKIYKVITSFFIAFFLALMFGLTFVFVAPTIARIAVIRHSFLLIVRYVLMGLMENLEYLTGANIHGYLPHLTAHKMLNYGYVTPEEMEQVSSLAIVRNPYSRMVSIYMYNRFGSGESFSHFVKSWYKNMKYYRESGEMEDWYTPCHVIPMFEYTHFEGAQMVQSIVKQEELKYLKNPGDIENAKDSSIHDLPKVVRDALLGMPHTNKRKTSKPWYDLYDQETLNLTYEMYGVDFQIFRYPSTISQRPDLHPPTVSNALTESAAISLEDGAYAAAPSSALTKQSVTTATATTTSSEEKTEEEGTAPLQSPPPAADQPETQQQQSPETPQMIRFESFTRDASIVSSDSASERKNRRSSLLLKSAQSSSRTSSMMGNASVRSLLYSSLSNSELLHLIDDDDKEGESESHANSDNSIRLTKAD